jgi:mannose-6-phosphate isomerase-like protein (cupin superfamily)
MDAPAVIAPGEGELVGDAPDRRVEILCEREALHATWTRFGPRRAGADLHVHRHHTDLFYVLAGELTARLGPAGEELAVAAGTLVRVPPLVVHGFRNGGDAELRYLNLHAPGRGFAGYLRALRDGRTLALDQEPPPADGGRPVTEAVIGGGEPLVEGVVLLADVEEIAIAEVRCKPGDASRSPGLHVHRRHAESFYVLDGELEVAVGDGALRAPAGSWLHVPPGVPHGEPACGPGPARYLDLHAPGFGLGTLDREPAA